MFENKFDDQTVNIQVEFETDGERDFIRVKHIDSKDEHVRPVLPADIEQFPEQWAVYQQIAGTLKNIEGTPITEIPMMTKDIATSIRLRGVATVEALAAIDDFGAMTLNQEHGVAWRNAAVMYLMAQEAAHPQIEDASEGKKAKRAA